MRKSGEMPEWPKGADCKSAGSAFGGSNPPLSTSFHPVTVAGKNRFPAGEGADVILGLGGNSSVGRALAFQAGCRGFESRFPLHLLGAHVAQLVEHILGKDEVSGSIPLMGSTILERVWPAADRHE